LRSLVEQATRAAASTVGEDVPPFWDEALGAVQRFYRTKITPELIADAADAYHANGLDGVKQTLLVGERQAWRYVRRAQEQGLLERQRAPRRAKEEKKR
jgi:hypothetical protein